MKSRRRNGALLVGLALAVLIVAGLVAPFVLPMPLQPIRLTIMVGDVLKKAPFAPGQFGYVFGTFDDGMDVLSVILLSLPSTLLVTVGVVALRALLAVPIGLAAGWYRRGLARLVTGLAVGTGVLPVMVTAALILSAVRQTTALKAQVAMQMGERLTTQPSLILNLAVLILIGLPRLAEQVRLLTDETLAMPFIESAVAAGARPWRILLRHALPAIRGEVLVTLAAEAAWTVILIGQLAIFGLEMGTGDLGAILGNTFARIRGDYWWQPAFPAIALGLIAICFQLLAEGLRVRWLRR